jgi:hypothetical protein
LQDGCANQGVTCEQGQYTRGIVLFDCGIELLKPLRRILASAARQNSRKQTLKVGRLVWYGVERKPAVQRLLTFKLSVH